ncbi:MAG: hypothetical protein GY749_37140 [Desulfobacteraceae bacterium]|nr:hypothetical protein [Desulfobacteraceae bacterium]
MKIFFFKDLIFYRISVFCFIFLIFFFASAEAEALPDKYEPDNTWDKATDIMAENIHPEYNDLKYVWSQIHNFYESADVDWIRFYGFQDYWYTIWAEPELWARCDPVIEIFASDGQTRIRNPWDYWGKGEKEEAYFKCEYEGIYYARISQCDNDISGCDSEYGEETEYTFTLFIPIKPGNKLFHVSVSPSDINADVICMQGDKIINELYFYDKYYFFSLEITEHTLKVSADCYEAFEEVISFNESSDPVGKEISLNPDPACNMWKTISGSVLYENTPLCAMVLANGQYMFSCGENEGKYELYVPLNDNGEITLFGFVDGFSPFKQTLRPEQAENYDISMSLASSDDPVMTLSPEFESVTNSERVKISGNVLAEDGTPLCAMVLANGQHMFSCENVGEYALEVPLNDNGEITLYGFCDGFKPFREILKPENLFVPEK